MENSQALTLPSYNRSHSMQGSTYKSAFLTPLQFIALNLF